MTSGNLPDLILRRAEPADFPAILRLQSANYVENLPPEERAQGFLSAEFTEEQIAAMAADLGIVVAVAPGGLAGYVCAFRNEFDHGSPVLARMFECYDRAELEGKLLRDYRTYVYGPVCVAREHRGSGVLRALYEAQKRDLAGRFDVGVAFVARDNPHSLAAHRAGLGMAEVGGFEVGPRRYAILAFRLPALAQSRPVS
ncbi:MAG TPA: GNAT family N-acetyltransferase [candidate division Zixibacteria bacterium]|nr:GNAT family N-acetyltransferase [candidate division Zixibacteria bacterium]